MTPLTASQRRALEGSGCELRCDTLTRQLYATDASLYRVEPRAVALPRSTAETAALLRAAGECGLAVIPRGAGTGLTGGAIGDGVVVDLARYRREIADLDLERRTVRVGPGVVLDQLNAFVAPHGLCFGPDVATSSRATLGGMIANNSSGAHAPVYGTTVDHLQAVEVVLADGTSAWVGAEIDGLPGLRATATEIVGRIADAITRHLPAGLVKRWPGYGFDVSLRRPGDLSQLIAGSEGTLAAVTSAVLRLVPRPRDRGLAVLFFSSVSEAMQATVELLDLEPAAIEHIDRLLVDQTRGQLAFARARALLGLDDDPAESLLLVELFDDVDDTLAMIAERGIGRRHVICRQPAEQELVWAVRRAGLSLLTSCKGASKPVTGIEDVCVRPEQLPHYIAGLSEILAPLGLDASFYGHAASGELHVRPTLDLHTADGVVKLRRIADEISDLCQRFRGSLAGEHGVGIARTEYLDRHLGPELVDASRRLKAAFDPRGVMNPGKIVDQERFRIDRDLRLGEGSTLALPFREALAWVGRDDSLVANLEQCNGCGGCRKDLPTMCPTFIATGDEIMSTRGRANAIRAALEGRLEGGIAAVELSEALSSCLSCKACKRECPSNVDLAQLKAELVHARHRRDGVPLRDRLIAAADRLGRLGTGAPRLANALQRWRPWRLLLQAALGINADRSLPRFADTRFDRWLAGRPKPSVGGRGRVLLWDDTWVRYHHPGIGQAAVRVLEALGFAVAIETRRRCCGRPAFSRGLLEHARRNAEHNVALLSRHAEPILFLEPSCWAMFHDEYRQLGVADAAELAERCLLIESFLAEVLADSPDELKWRDDPIEVAVHVHCHEKALSDPRTTLTLLGAIPGVTVRRLDTGCCGMAGAFGLLKDKEELSELVAAPLLAEIDRLPPDTILVASGTSCRHQIDELSSRRAIHPIELIASRLVAVSS